MCGPGLQSRGLWEAPSPLRRELVPGCRLSWLEMQEGEGSLTEVPWSPSLSGVDRGYATSRWSIPKFRPSSRGAAGHAPTIGPTRVVGN